MMEDHRGEVEGRSKVEGASGEPGVAVLLDEGVAPAGFFDLETEIRSTPNPAGTRLVKASLVRTARRIFEGTIIIPQT